MLLETDESCKMHESFSPKLNAVSISHATYNKQMMLKTRKHTLCAQITTEFGQNSFLIHKTVCTIGMVLLRG